MGGDVDYRKGHLKLLNSEAITTTITSPVVPTDPSEITTLVDVLSTATQNDPSGTIGFLALWGHGGGGNVYGYSGGTTPTGYLAVSDIGSLKNAVTNGDIVFNENSIICITACNAGSSVPLDVNGVRTTTSFAQELSDATGARVIAGAYVGANGDGGVSPKVENPGQEMSYQMRNYSKGSFFEYRPGQNPVELGNTVDFGSLMERATEQPLMDLEPKGLAPIPVN